MQFKDLGLIDQLLRAVTAEGYEIPTPIQVQAIPPILLGKDLLGAAQTGTGKTAAFALPMLQRLGGHKPNGARALILTPTRELATQIGDSFATYGQNLGMRHAVVFGGVAQGNQVRTIRRGVDIIVATPGRLLDLCNQRLLDFRSLEIFVLDEADRMLDMGFIHDVRRIVKLIPERRQTLFFSATMPPDIESLAGSILRDPVRVAVTPIASTADKIEQSVYFVAKTDKRALLQHLLQDTAIRRALVFTRTKHGADRVVDQLERAQIGAMAIHGNKSQGARERALEGFRRGTTRVLVATDIAARGIDVDGISHVINYDLPNIPESYVHRIGRTARAGASGIAFSFCDREERSLLVDIERLIRQRVPVVAEHPHQEVAGPSNNARPAQRGNNGNNGGRGGNNYRGGGGGNRRSSFRGAGPRETTA